MYRAYSRRRRSLASGTLNHGRELLFIITIIISVLFITLTCNPPNGVIPATELLFPLRSCGHGRLVWDTPKVSVSQTCGFPQAQ